MERLNSVLPVGGGEGLEPFSMKLDQDPTLQRGFSPPSCGSVGAELETTHTLRTFETKVV